MALIHLAATLATETPQADRRTDKTRFYWSYARGYALRSLQGSKGGEGTADAPTLVRVRKVSGSEASRKGRSIRASKHTRGVWIRQHEATADDLAQEAFLLFWAARGRAARGEGHAIDTRTAIRDAVRQYRQRERQRSFARRCGVCRYATAQCDHCVQRAADDATVWAASGRPTAMASETRDTLAEVTVRDVSTIVDDSMPDADGSKTRTQLQLLIRWVASGSSLTDIAGELGVSPQRVQTLLSKLRNMFTPTDFMGEVVGKCEQMSNRTYGDRPGCVPSSSVVGMIADMYDREYGHMSAAISTDTEGAPPWAPWRKEWHDEAQLHGQKIG